MKAARLRTAAWTSPRRGSGLVMILALGLAGTLVGCRKSPISSDAPRSPYERYAAVRGEVQPKTVTDSFGREQPNLRGRLGQSD